MRPMAHRSGIAACALVSLLSIGVQGGRMLNVGDAMIHHADTGRGEPVVFVHGWTQDLTIWDGEAAEFAATHRVIRYDRRGYGRSTGHADPTADPADLLALLDSLGIRRVTVVGLSAGAQAAIAFAMAFPERLDRLVLYGLGTIDGFPGPRIDPAARQAFADIARRHGLDSLWKALMASGMFWRPPGEPPRERPEYWSRYNGRDLTDPRAPSGRVARASWDRIATLTMPLLIINGAHDMPGALAFADSTARRLPHARRAIIPDAGHGAHFQQPERFRAALREFLESTPVRR